MILTLKNKRSKFSGLPGSGGINVKQIKERYWPEIPTGSDFATLSAILNYRYFNIILLLSVGSGITANMTTAKLFPPFAANILIPYQYVSIALFSILLLMNNQERMRITKVLYMLLCGGALISTIMLAGVNSGALYIFLLFPLMAFLLFQSTVSRVIIIGTVIAGILVSLLVAMHFGIYHETDLTIDKLPYYLVNFFLSYVAVISYMFYSHTLHLNTINRLQNLNITLSRTLFERNELNQKLTKTLESVRKQNERLEQMNFVLMHNLRAPLATGLSMTEIVKMHTTDPVLCGVSIDKLRVTLLRMDDTLRGVNMIVEKLQLSPEDMIEMPLLSIINEVMAMHDEAMKKTGAYYSLHCSADFFVRCKKEFLLSIIDNMMTNAIKFRSNDRKLFISINCIEKNDGVEILFNDNGEGMDLRKFGKRLFHPFYQTQANTPGSGLGLYMIKTQIEQMGGTVSLESKPGIGTKLSLHLPK